MRAILLFLLIAGAAAFGLLNYHVILFDDSVRFLKKTGIRYEDTFVDARGANKLELLTKTKLLEAGFKDLVNQADDFVKEKSSGQ